MDEPTTVRLMASTRSNSRVFRLAVMIPVPIEGSNPSSSLDPMEATSCLSTLAPSASVGGAVCAPPTTLTSATSGSPPAAAVPPTSTIATNARGIRNAPVCRPSWTRLYLSGLALTSSATCLAVRTSDFEIRMPLPIPRSMYASAPRRRNRTRFGASCLPATSNCGSF